MAKQKPFLELIDAQGKTKKYTSTDKLLGDLSIDNIKNIIRLHFADGRVKDMILYPPHLRRLIGMPVAKVLFKKRVETMLNA